MRPRPTVGGRPLLLAALALLLTSPAAVPAAEFSLRSETLVRVFERDTPDENGAEVVPLYEYLQADLGRLNSPGVSLHLYGWGRIDLGDSGYYPDAANGELLYGYLEYTRPASNLTLRLGRQYVFHGLTSDSLDGLRVDSDLGRYFAVSLYGGLPVAYDTTRGRDGDLLYGGRLAHRFGTRYEIGLSYRELRDDGEDQDRRVGGDLYLALPAGISLDGRSVYNLETDGWGEHAYQARFVLAGLQFRPYFEDYDYRDYFAPGEQVPSPFRALARQDETLTSVGLDLARPLGANWELGARGKHIDYDLQDDAAWYYSGLLTWHGEDSTQIGGEAGVMQGDAVENDYLLGRVFVYLDLEGNLPAAFLSGDLVYVRYDREIRGEDRSLFASLGGGWRFLEDRLEVRLSGDYSNDPNFDSDWRALLAATFRFSR